MSLILPDFKATQCLGIATCGEIDGEAEQALALVEEFEGRTFAATYKSGESEAVLLLSLGGLSPYQVHLDAHRRELFPENDRGEQWPLEELLRYLKQLEGVTITGRAYGRYVLPVDELSPWGIIGGSLFDRGEGSVSIKMSDARFEIRGAPIRSMAWSLVEDDQKIMIDLEAALSETVEDDYLVKQLTLIDSAFRIFVAGEKRHGPS